MSRSYAHVKLEECEYEEVDLVTPLRVAAQGESVLESSLK